MTGMTGMTGMIEKFLDAAENLDSEYIKKWKDKGGKVAGYTCSFLPVEVLHAAGILPFRLWGKGTTSMAIGDAYFGPFICSFPKCILQLAGEKKYDFLDGAIITPGCDSVRRIDECWRKAAEDIGPGVIPDFFHYFHAPHKKADHCIEWFADEIRVLMKALEEHFGVTISDEALLKSVEEHNKSAELLVKLSALRSGDTSRINGVDALTVILAGLAMPREEYNTLLEAFLTELEKAGDAARGRKRLMLLGSVNDDIEFIKTIEGERGIVIADDLCFNRGVDPAPLERVDDPAGALAEKYLGYNVCPRMFGGYKERLARIVEKIETARVDGVVLLNIRFCDLHGSENGLYERELEARGVPCIKLEREYGPQIATGRIRMRMDAFYERLDKKG
ncbi:MAG: 2-hydroxyacyl-CoA dehydratase [Desulfobacterales bacterium]|nr:2-hydroxyacyl-CoA dehydratase [Desulfobacterales bacterium]